MRILLTRETFLVPEHFFLLLRAPNRTRPSVAIHDGSWLLSVAQGVPPVKIASGALFTHLESDPDCCAAVEIPTAIPTTFSDWSALICMVTRALGVQTGSGHTGCHRLTIDAMKEFYFGANGCPFEYYRSQGERN